MGNGSNERIGTARSPSLKRWQDPLRDKHRWQRWRRLVSRTARLPKQMFVSEKTVEAHLSAVYRKLSIARRTQLHDALGQAEPVRAS